MGEVRRADGDEVDAFVLGTRRLGSDHVLPGVVDTRGVETEEASLLPPAFGVHVKCTRDELDAAVDPHRHPVDISDEGADAAHVVRVSSFQVPSSVLPNFKVKSP